MESGTNTNTAHLFPALLCAGDAHVGSSSGRKRSAWRCPGQRAGRRRREGGPRHFVSMAVGEVMLAGFDSIARSGIAAPLPAFLGSCHSASRSKVCARAQPTLCNPNCTLSGSPVHGILQARTLGWVAISFSRGPSQPEVKPVSPVYHAWRVDSLPTEPLEKSCQKWSVMQNSTRSPVCATLGRAVDVCSHKSIC